MGTSSRSRRPPRSRRQRRAAVAHGVADAWSGGPRTESRPAERGAPRSTGPRCTGAGQADARDCRRHPSATPSAASASKPSGEVTQRRTQLPRRARRTRRPGARAEAAMNGSVRNVAPSGRSATLSVA